ncbi:extracellular solute-binding protein, partial [Bradyrhizobium sp. 143]|uniref:extracellular solute-binding protein n=1 Tax=Bradyrhizobium sp. 143 TaxID=2782619 RepID=UPI001FFBC57A
AGPIGVGSYEWYQVLDDFLQGRTAMAIDSSNFATDISNPAKSHVAKQAGFAAFLHLPGREPVPFMSHWQACINSKSKNKQAAFLFLLWATSKPTLVADRARWQRHGCRPGRARLSVTHSAGKPPRQH